MKRISYLILFTMLAVACQPKKADEAPETSKWEPIRVSDNGHYFQYENGDPFFWLGDTGWLLFKKLDRNEAAQYLETRKAQGYNVLQVMVLHSLGVTNYQGDAALVDENIADPLVTPGNDPSDSLAYDYWDHVEYIVDLAAEKGLYMALVPVWGTPVSGDHVTVDAAEKYAAFLADRFASKPNIIWLNGGDIRGDNHQPVWQAIGSTIDSLDNEHLITFHPRGRTMSSEWFHNEDWLDFNMFQSGHRNYEQDTARDSHRFGPDNWKYIDVEFAKTPTKPTLDGEPSYEGIPEGLHDTTQAFWEAQDLRRYAYWSVFAGGAGFTYGSNSVMQFYNEKDNGIRAYGAKTFWKEAINDPGAKQMIYLKDLMLSQSYFDRVPAQELVLNQKEKYEYIIATKGADYAVFYTYTGREIEAQLGVLSGEKLAVNWFDPRTGKTVGAEDVENTGSKAFDPPGDEQEGNDWVLILNAKS